MNKQTVLLLLGTIASSAGLSILPAQESAARRTTSSAEVSQSVASITAAIVLADMTVRPIPLLDLILVNASNELADSIHFHTGLDGKASQAVPSGRYRLLSTTPVAIEGKSYMWDVEVDLLTGNASRIELTNLNATTSSVAAVRQVTPEHEVFTNARSGVFRVESGLALGSGFLIGEQGANLVVTNDHVVAGSSTATVYIDSVTRVNAQVVVRDADADLAILRIPADRCAHCSQLQLARADPNQPLVIAGERVLAIGFPLSQEMTLTTGIVSSVRAGAIISDVNINHGNSGGPMLNLSGEVVAVNTFLDAAPGGSGPGISGAVVISRLTPLLGRVPSAMAALPPIDDRLLPTMPRATYPLPLLKTFADTADARYYRFFTGRDAGNFTVSLLTPTLLRVLQKQEENEVSKDRRKREAKAGISEDERYSELHESHDWEQYVGSGDVPVVTLLIRPKVGETFWSSFGRSLEAYSYGRSLSAAKMKFKGDVRGVRVYRNGVEVHPIRGGHGPLKMLVNDQWIEMKDVADRGYYVFEPELFEPDSTGAPPMVSVVVQDLKNPETLSSVDVWGQTAARVWNDFEPYYSALQPDRPFLRANPELETKVPLVCDPQSGECAVKRKN